MALHDLLIAPFSEFAFMRRALIACIAISLSAGPIGSFLVLRRMSLMGDAMSHAVLPGVALGFLFFGLDLWSMALGGLVASLAVALLAGVVSRVTPLKEDTSLAGFYLISIASGVLIISLHGSNVDLMHILFGSLLGVDDRSLLLVAGAATLTLFAFAVIYRPLVVECFDPGFLRVAAGGRSGSAIGGPGAVAHLVFLVLVVVNLVAGMQALGTLMSVGLLLLPAAAARLWAGSVGGLMLTTSGIAMAASLLGLVLSYHVNAPSGPAIVLVAGFFYIASLAFGQRGGLVRRYLPRRHLAH
ncbi:metal ABC transporter permease [Dongia sedimenti]|uniref:Metal ABC transporter permease n=1 Tax=Dongia sedimenti TaxID=3064282 RepID=A0ABU0YPA3_9PROT|nr:metal ABC transporter permease [Rhodospirillaceae bacterium R-7]